MTERFRCNDHTVTLLKKGADIYSKISYPLRYGVFSEIETKKAILQFNKNGEIIHAKGKGREWPFPQEWLKRSMGNDWIYYSTGGYTGVFEAIGEFYLPNLPYPTNSLLGGKPFVEKSILELTTFWYELLEGAVDKIRNVPESIDSFLRLALTNTPERLEEKAQNLFSISEGRVTVLPPDTRHVDYDVIPLMLAEGCLYKCRFCKVKTKKPYREKSKEEIDGQIARLKHLYGDNLANYNSVFFGEHDVLCVSPEVVLYGVEKAYAELELSGSYMRGCNFFFFGSVDSLLEAPDKLFTELRNLPCSFYINIGLESADQETLDFLGKPITCRKVEEAFARMQDINDSCSNIELTANFIMDEELPKGHYPAFLKLVREKMARVKPKGCIYLSPLKFSNPNREKLFVFNRFKVLSRLPTFLYIIQRL